MSRKTLINIVNSKVVLFKLVDNIISKNIISEPIDLLEKGLISL